MARPSVSPEIRFWKFVEQIPFHSCWEWTGNRERGGYGTFWDGTRKSKAHVYSYKYHNGPVLNGLKVCHSCDNPSCVNPRHLWLGTSKDNAIDCVKKGRRPSGERHHLAKLTYADVVSIRDLLSNKEATQTELAMRYGVGKTTISAIFCGQNWSKMEEVH